MPTQIIDNFELTSELPLDARIVVGPNAFYQTKDLIEYKYYGLRVWDFNFNLPFVWTGTTWSNENVGSALVSNGQGGYLPKFLGSGTSNTLSNSIIFDNGTGRIGIGTTSPLQKLDVSGNIKATQFYGNGSTITSINASNIVNGILNLGLLNTSGAGSNWLLAMNGTATWTNNFQLRVGSSKAIVIENETSSSNNFDLLFYQSTDIFAMDLANGTVANPYSYIPKSARTGNNRIQFKPQTGQLLFSNGNKTSPSISFRNSTGVGAYFDTDIAASYNGLTFTVNQNGGSKRLTVSAGGGVGNFGSNLILYSNTNDQTKLIITHLDNSDTYFSSYNQGNPGGSIYFTNQTLFRVESPTVLTSTLNVGTNLTTTGNSTTNNNMFVYQRAVIGGTNLDATSVNARLMVVANGTSGAALFTSNQWSAFGHQSTIYIGDSLHYIRSNYAGTFDIKSGDSIKLISGASTRVYLNNSSGNVGIGTESPTSRLTVNGNIRTDSDFVTGTDTAGWINYPLPEYWVQQFANSVWNVMANAQVDYTNTDLYEQTFVRYKKIGKTVIFQYNVRIKTNASGNINYGGPVALLLPAEFQVGGASPIKDFNTTNPTTDCGMGDSIGYGYAFNNFDLDGSGGSQMVTFIQVLRRYDGGVNPFQTSGVGSWHIYLGPINSSYFPGRSYALRGQFITTVV